MNSFHRDSVSEFCWSWTGGAVSLILAQQRCCFFNMCHNIGVCVEVVTLFNEYLCICIVPNTSHVYIYIYIYTISWLWHVVILPIWASRNSTIQGLLLPLLQPPLGQSLDLWLLSTAEWWFWVEISTISTLLETNISPEKSILKMIFLLPRWDMLISWRVSHISTYLSIYFNRNHNGHQFWGLILIKQRSLDRKGSIWMKKHFKVLL